MPRATKAETSATTGPRLVKSVVKSTPTKASPTLSPESVHELITKRAYELYLQEGSIDGRDVEHWLQAEQEMAATLAPIKKPAGRTTRTAS